MINYKLEKTLLLTGIFILISIAGCNHPKKENLNVSTESLDFNENSKWSNDLIKAYKALYEERNVASANLLEEASDLMPKKNWENYFVVATIYAPNGEQGKAFQSLEKAIQYGLKDSELITTTPELSNLKGDLRWENMLKKVDSLEKVYLKRIENPDLLRELQNMWTQDQLALSQYEEKINSLDSTASYETHQKLFKPVEERWELNRKKLDSIIIIHGWPGNRLVGEDGAKLAWAIPQHYPDVFYKEKCLVLIKEAIEKGDVDPNYYAELNDRIAREIWQKQTYGASMGKNAPYPIRNPAEVNKKRLELGLFEPVEVYAFYHGIEYQLPTKKEIQFSYEKAQTDYKKFENFISMNKVDSANVYVEKAIAAHGDINNAQLYKASILLAQTNNDYSQKISLRILKVLIWRKWKKRFEILKQNEFDSLYSRNDWSKVEKLLKKSE